MSQNVISLLMMFLIFPIDLSSATPNVPDIIIKVPSHLHYQDESVAGQLFFNSLDEWINRINTTLNGHLHDKTKPLSDTCFSHLSILIRAAKERQPWALRVFDSFGKPGAGIMEASLSFLGFYSECVESHARRGKEILFSGKYCMASMHLPNAALTALQKFAGLSTNTIAAPLQPRIGICLPSTCSHEEIQQVASDAMSLFIQNATLTVTACNGPTKEVTKDLPALIVIGFFIVFLAIVLIGTLIDYFKNYHHLSETTMTNVNTMTILNSQIVKTVEKHPSSLLQDSLASFSLIENTKNVLSKSTGVTYSNGRDSSKPSGNFEVLNGLRVLMMIWIVVLHSYSFGMQWLFFRNPKELHSAPKHILSQFFANGTFSVDSFFFISGLLVTNSCLKQLSKNNGKLDLFSFYFHRYLRMTPLMMVIILFSSTLLKYLGEGPSFQESTIMFDSWCQENGWLNALYLHNFIRRENMCLGHTWYSAVDMQLFLFAPLLLVPLYKRPRVGLALIGVALLTSVSYTAFITISRNLPAVPYLMIDIVSQESISEYYASIYIKPYARAGPYLVGMALGYILFMREGGIRLTKKQAVLGWTLSTLANLGVLFAMLPVYAGYSLPSSLAGIYSATSRVIWALSLAWMTFASCAGRGGIIGSLLSAKGWLPWSRLSYAGYLIHPVIMAVFYGSQETTFEFSHLLMIYLILGNLILTYGISFFLSVLFELPFVQLEKVWTRRRGERK